MRENGNLTKGMASDLRGLVMETHMKENTKKVKFMDKAGMSGKLVNIMKANGRRVSRTDTVFGVEDNLTHTSDNGKTISPTGSVSTPGVTEMSMKESGKHA